MTDDGRPALKRRCTGPCGRILPFTREYFYRANEPPYLRGDCIECFKSRHHERRYEGDAPSGDTNRARQRARKEAINRMVAMQPKVWERLLTQEYRRAGLSDPKFHQGRRR